MDKELTKSLNDLIDETLSELEELRKSRFSASEIKIEGPGDGIGGKPSNGDLHAKGEDKDEDDDKDDKDMDKGDDMNMDKGENNTADPNGGHHKPVAGEGQKHGAGPSKSPGGHGEQPKGGTNRQADPNGGRHEMDKAEKDEDDKDDPQPDEKGHEEKEKKIAKKLLAMHKAEMEKSAEQHESLMKSYVEEKIQPLEDKLSTILDLVNKLSEQPVAPRGTTARTQPLFKSDADVGETLSKAQVADKLFELKKSGTYVDSMDVAKAEMGTDLDSIVRKYKIS